MKQENVVLDTYMYDSKNHRFVIAGNNMNTDGK